MPTLHYTIFRNRNELGIRGVSCQLSVFQGTQHERHTNEARGRATVADWRGKWLASRSLGETHVWALAQGAICLGQARRRLTAC